MANRELSKHDDDLAELLLDVAPAQNGPPLKDLVRFDHGKQQWHIWDTKRWAADKTALVFDLIRDCAVKLLLEASGSDAKSLVTLLDRGKKESVLKSLAARRQIAMTGEEWDPDPTLLAFVNGVLDLKTLDFNPDPSPSLLLSRSTRQPYDPDAEAPRFVQLLQEIMGGDDQLADYLYLVLGYSLFGWQREQKFWIWVGQGQNGKGTLAKAVAHAMGDYAESPSAELYMRTRFGTAGADKPRPELLRLQGTRFAWMSEPAGGRFNEEMLKSHTGDDPIQARDLYGKAASFTTFRPSHTIFFLTNDPPHTEDVGLSMRRRARVIKFLEDFTGPREDKTLEQQLRAEAPGILAMLAKAAKVWFDAGSLPEPEQIIEWSNEYIDENDPMTPFIADCLVVEPNAGVSATVVWFEYQEWCAKQGIEAGSRTTFGTQLSRKFKRIKRVDGMRYVGIRMKSAMETAQEGRDD